MGILDELEENAKKAADEAIAEQKEKLEARKAQEQAEAAAKAQAEENSAL
jgi:hypothetical protein